MRENQKIIIAVTGASGSIYAKRIIHYLSQQESIEVGIVFSSNAKEVWKLELQEEPTLPFKIYGFKDYSAAFASGSAKYNHMVIIPCSMGTMGRIANGISDDLISRAADVILKERRQLICVARETPLSMIHLDNMQKITKAGGIILPAAPSFYGNPTSIIELVDTVIFRILDLLGIDVSPKRWGN